MASEITYAEVRFKNASPAAEVEVGAFTLAPPEKKKHEHHTLKYPPWLPWLISLLLLLVCIALIVTLLVIRFSHHHGEMRTLRQNATEWLCASAVPQRREHGWMCCPKEWKLFQKSCYYISTDNMSWNDSRENCTRMGSHLVVIKTEAEQVFLSTWIRENNKPRRSNYYIGLSAQNVGEWHWVDQTPLNVTAAFWRAGEPSNVKNEKCVVIHQNEERHRNWNDIPCNINTFRICEAAAVTV